MGEISQEIDLSTLWRCDGKLLLARWKYVLDTSDDGHQPNGSEGQLMLRGDGNVSQRVVFSERAKFDVWHEPPRAPAHDGPYTIAEVERIFRDYDIARLPEPPDPLSPNDLRRQLKKRLVLMGSVCRKLGREEATGDLASSGSQAAYGVLLKWMRETYGFYDLDFRYGLGDPAVQEAAPDLMSELGLAAKVCDDLSFVYSAGVGLEFERDMESLRQSVRAYLTYAR